MQLTVDLVCAGLIAVPAVMALASGPKDAVTRGVLIALAVIGALLIAAIPIDELESLLERFHLVLILAIAAGALAIAAVIRLPNRVLGSLILVGGLMLAARAFEVLGGWAIV
ncbi:MAG: hypothetical protein H0X45_05085 [Planctomycetes bacterium]|nr:hypothetical protein [Planctomycetota bacterium]